VLGLSGCIAAYKAAYLVRLLKKEGAEVRVVMTAAAEKFITRLTMETLSDNPAYCEMFPEQGFYTTHHISLAEWADLILLAPASGNLIGKIANGIADDLLTTVVMAAQSPVMIAPSMNTHMYENRVVQENMARLKKLGYKFIEPEVGDLACHTHGVGRLAEPPDILEAIIAHFGSMADLDGLKILVTAGPTVEYIDAVRYISNPSSGRLGYALARKAMLRGAEVTLISGPVNLDAPEGMKLVLVTSAKEMLKRASENFENCDMLFMAAAVSDYAPAETAQHKIKKSSEPLKLTLQPQADILLELSKVKRSQVVVGFAMETENELENATSKLKKKKLDLIIVNNVTEEGAGFAVETNKVTIIDKNGNIEKPPLMTKEELADIIIDHALKYHKKKA
jgi:phosphopantothenoylcysteine decarboxylase/phosphopantothenate--cysteine ligase